MPTDNMEDDFIEAVWKDGETYLVRDGEWAVTDRKRGILTESDREYLLDQSSLEGQDRRNIRYRIRQRLTEALLDIILINEVSLREDLEQVLESDRIDDEFLTRNMVEFAYHLLRFAPSIENPIDEFERLIEIALLEGVEPSSDGDVSMIDSNAELEVKQSKVAEMIVEDDETKIVIDDSVDNPEEIADSIVFAVEEGSGEEHPIVYNPDEE